MTYEWAKPGVKVVCIHDFSIKARERSTCHLEMYPALNGIYTIRSVVASIYQDSAFALRFQELRNPLIRYSQGLQEIQFSGKYFRPLIDKRLPDSLTILLEKPNRFIVPDGGKWDVRKTKEKEKSR